MGRYVAFSTELGEWKAADLIRKKFLVDILIPKLWQLVKQIGYFSKLNDVHTKQMLFEQWLEDNQQYKGKIDFKEFNDIQQRQIKALVIELRVLLAFAALIFLLGSDFDEDGIKFYKQNYLTRKLASVIFKTNQELSFVFNPIDFSSMIKNPVPMISILTDGVKTIQNTTSELYDTVSGQDAIIGKGDENKDKSPRGYYLSKMIPGANGFIRLVEGFSDDVQYLNTPQ